jgi:hypothetical protein
VVAGRKCRLQQQKNDKTMSRPQYLKEGDRVAIAAPARKITPDELLPAVKLLESWGLEVELPEHLFDSDNQFAGSDTVKVNVKVLKKNALSDTEWTVVYTTAEPVSITSEMHETIPVQIDDQDLASGFFKLELEEVP